MRKKSHPSLRELARLIRAWDDVENHPEQVSKIMERAVTKYPDFAPGWGHLGLAYMQSGRAKDAERALKKAVDLEPQGAGWHLALSTFYKLVCANAKGLMAWVERTRKLAEAGVEFSQELGTMPPAYVGEITLEALGITYEYARQMAEKHAKDVLNLTEDKEFTHPAINNLLEISTTDRL